MRRRRAGAFVAVRPPLLPDVRGGPRRVPRRQAPRCMAAEPSVVMYGFPILEAFKGVFIGPTVNELASAVAGGTVGVMGTILALEVGRQQATERKQCPYCRGTGKLACGRCYGLGEIPTPAAARGKVACDHCPDATGYLVCHHCSGDGRLIPIEYERALRAQYEDYVFRDGRSTLDDYYPDEGPPYL